MEKSEKKPEKRLISIVDDDRSARESTRLLIRCCGFRTESFSSAQEFLDSGQVAETACLILDVRMPKMCGIDLQKHLRQKGFKTPVLFLTAHGDESDRARAMEGGASAFMQKPVSEETLLQSIHTALDIPRKSRV